MTATMSAAARWKTPIAVTVLLVLLLALVVSGQWPGLHNKLSSSPKGLVAIAPSEVERVDIRSGTNSVALRRQAGGWAIEGVDGGTPAQLGSHIDTALKFLEVSEPPRELPAAELAAESFAAFGLDPPSEVAVLETHSAVTTTVNFGMANPAGTSHYVRLGGAPTVFLMPRHVTGRVAAGVRHGAAAARQGRLHHREPQRGSAVAGLDGAGVGHRDRCERQAHPLRA